MCAVSLPGLRLRSRERFVLYMFRFQHLDKRVTEQIGVVAVVEPEAHFIEIGLQMLCAKTMPRTNKTALEQGECGFDRVCVNICSGSDVLASTVAHSLMPSAADSFAVGAAVFVGHNHIHILGDVLADVLRQSSALGVLCVKEPEIAAALPDADNDLFVAVTETSLAKCVLAATDVGFVNLYGSPKFLNGRNRLHSRTDAMAEIPCCLVTDTQHPLELVGAHSLAGLAQDVGRKEPLGQRKVRIVEHGSRQNGELVTA